MDEHEGVLNIGLKETVMIRMVMDYCNSAGFILGIFFMNGDE